MGFFSKKKTISAGLVLDAEGFRYLSLEGGDGFYNVVDSVSGSVPPVSGASDDPFSDYGAYLDPVFDHIAQTVRGFNVAVNFALPVTESLLRIVNLPGMTLRANASIKVKNFVQKNDITSNHKPKRII